MTPPRAIIEPFRIKAVEPLPLPSPDERKAALRRAHHNPFLLRAFTAELEPLSP